MIRRDVGLLILLVTGCGIGRQPVVVSPVYHPPSWQERQLALRQTWDTLVAERSARAQRVTIDQAAEAEADAFRQLPAVSLTTGGQMTLAEAIAVLLTDLPYTVVYGLYVEPTLALSTHIAHQRLDRAVATLVHPLGYQVTMDPTRREIHIDAMATRHWAVSPRPTTDTQFWSQLTETLQTLVHDSRDGRANPGYVVINPEIGEVTVSARVPRIPLIEAHMQPLAVATTAEEALAW